MLYLLLVYTIPVSEFFDVVPNSDVSKSVTSKKLYHIVQKGKQREYGKIDASIFDLLTSLVSAFEGA